MIASAPRTRFLDPKVLARIRRLDLIARTEIKEYEVTLNLSGPLDRLNASFSSNPPLADLEVLALMATGQAAVSSGLAADSQVTSVAAAARSASPRYRLRLDIARPSASLTVGTPMIEVTCGRARFKQLLRFIERLNENGPTEKPKTSVQRRMTPDPVDSVID